MLKKLINNRRRIKADENALIVAIGVIIGLILLFTFGMFFIMNIVNIGMGVIMIGIGILALGAGVMLLKKGIDWMKKGA